MNAVRQSGWVLAARVVPQAGGVALLIVGARFLSPELLGRFVLIFAGVELLRRLVRAGWREAVVVGVPETIPVIMGLSLAAGALSQVVTLGLAAAAWRWGDAEYGLCVLLLGATLAPLAPTAVWEGLLMRRGQAEREARPQIVAEAAHLACAVLLLWLGLGILGLACARLLRAVLLAAGLGRATGWLLAVGWDREVASSVLPLSGNVTASSLINFTTTYGIDLIVGFWLGPASVAFFRIGTRIAGGTAEVLNETVRVMAWSRLSAASGPGIAEQVALFLDRMLILVAPVLVGLALVAQPLVMLLLGEHWLPAAPVVALIAVARLLQLPLTVAWPALTAVGQSRLLPRLTAVVAATTVGLILLLGQHGLVAIAIAQVLAGLASGAATLWLLNRTLGSAALPRPLGDVTSGLAAMTLAVVATSAVAPLLVQVAAGGLAYAGVLRWRRNALWRELVVGLTRA